MSIVRVDTSSEVAVTSYLEQARDWLSRAVDETGPEQIAAAKAEIATAAEATKQLGLSKEIQLDAQEMVRRAEYALGKAIRKGQAEGRVGGDHGGDRRSSAARELDRPTDYATRRELYGSDAARPGILTLTDSAASLSDGVSDKTFDRAIEEAKAEGNLSRANVARKIIGKSAPAPAPAGSTERAHQEAELINAFGSIVRRSLTPANVATLSPRARKRLISILNDALTTLQENDS